MFQTAQIVAACAIMSLTAPLAFGEANLPAALPKAFQRGLCIEGTRPLDPCHTADISDYGATHVSLNPFGWMNSASDPELRYSTEMDSDPSRRFWGESNPGLLQYAEKAHEANLEVMLRPHIWIRNSKNSAGDFAWLDSIDFESEADKITFGENYRAYALHFARIAEQGNMEWYSIGAETLKLSTQYPDYWRDLIREIRTVYSGKLIYSANWYAEVEGIEFWDDLDAIGVQAYYPLTYDEDSSKLTKEKLTQGWEQPLKTLEAVSKKFNKPVIFTEIGYKSTTDSALEPWEWQGEGETSDALQKMCYEATFDALKGNDFISGIYWWKYHVYDCENLDSVPDRRVRDFSFQNKPAEDVVRINYE